MHVVVNRNTLTDALSRVQGILVKNSTNLALACVLLTARNGKLTVTATDTMTTMVAKYEADTTMEGVVAVDGSLLYQVVRSWGADTVVLKTTGTGRLRVSCGASVANMNTLSEDDFPPTSAGNGTAVSKFTIRGADLARLHDQTAFAVSGEENRYGLNGTHAEYVRGDDGAALVRFCATDGSRLAWSQAPAVGLAPNQLVLSKKGLLPKKGFAEVRKNIKVADESWTVEADTRTVVFECGDLRITARLVEGEFPDYRQVVPDAGSTSHRITMERGALLDALRRISLFATDRLHSTKFDFGSDTLVLEASNLEAGDAREDMPATLVGEPFKTGFNAKFWQDVLACTRGDLTAEISAVLDPCLVSAKDDPHFRAIIMPIRLD